jgi:hypothetical protein
MLPYLCGLKIAEMVETILQFHVNWIRLAVA